LAKSNGPSWKIEPFNRGFHDRHAFDCGDAQLNHWLQKLASQYEKRGLARTYVLIAEGDPTVRGYYAISSHTVVYEALPDDQSKGLPQIDVPVVLLGRLAIDLSVQGKQLGEFLLLDALRRAKYLAERIGIRAVEVDAINEQVKQFYQKYGFIPLEDTPHHLFLPISTIRKLKLPPL